MVLFKANGRNVHTINNKLCIIFCCLESKRKKHLANLNDALKWIYEETGIYVDFEWYTKDRI